MAAGTLPSLVVGAAGHEGEPVSVYLRDQMLGDASTATCRSFGYDLLRRYRVLLCTMSNGTSSRGGAGARSNPRDQVQGEVLALCGCV
ncbi:MULTISPECIES: hypothetical protein [unclassified Streptomyces]|uniref:hypothetical protein n=1 Tax=unclassified Streptomyces TaxID=2593676 RepID=UPI00381F0AD9